MAKDKSAELEHDALDEGRAVLIETPTAWQVVCAKAAPWPISSAVCQAGAGSGRRWRDM